MAKVWYPVIDYLECMECGSCIKKCSHGVYDKSKAPSPVVSNPAAFIDHCHGCGNLCRRGTLPMCVMIPDGKRYLELGRLLLIIPLHHN